MLSTNMHLVLSNLIHPTLHTRTHKKELDKFISQVLPDRLKALEDWLLRSKVGPRVSLLSTSWLGCVRVPPCAVDM